MSLGSVLRSEWDRRNMSMRAFCAMSDEVVEKHTELGRANGISISTLSQIVNGVARPDLETLHIIALTLANEDRNAGEWLFRLIVEAGYPLADLELGDLKRWTEETRGETVDPSALAELKRLRREIDDTIRRLSER